MLAQAMVAFAEALLLGQKMGLDKTFLLEFLPNTAVAPPFAKAKAEMIKTGDYTVQFPLEWMHKDLQLLAQTAYAEGQSLYLANLTKEIYQDAKRAGLGREDFAAVYQWMKKEA